MASFPVLAAAALAAVALSGCDGPFGSDFFVPSEPPEGCDLPQAGEATGEPTAFFRRGPADAARTIAHAYGMEITGVQRGPEETAGGRTIQWWTTTDNGSGFITLTWTADHIELVEVQGGGMSRWEPVAVVAALPAGMPLTVTSMDEESWSVAQETPIGPARVAGLWTPWEEGVAAFDVSATFTFPERAWLTPDEAEARARQAGHCEGEAPPDEVEALGPRIADGHLVYAFNVVHGPCWSQVHQVDAATGADIPSGEFGWCG